MIIKDEQISAHILQDILNVQYPEIEVLASLHSVVSAVKWFEQNDDPHLIFMDIELSDGLSFDLFKLVDIKVPIIFTTAFDQYALKAFKVNSLDYILKPINPSELKAAIDKYKELQGVKVNYEQSVIQELVKSLSRPSYRERFMVKSGQNLGYVNTNDLLYAFA